ncbi:hypothetical protein PGT21_019401 [Puccinia graminis f. sp. tritici]|uniref:Uncharacterized protein n=1 Tax=Puccinia graminis f. sp. tritici TaxID=56615 RepID=A0A5B0P7A4_PUCGR|nr:hypothetical protein PGT21_019401 [Puccinia graminis f. sp. tritici]KAA1131903.1 hypothetical protein PGTUg99_033269 [Puccinia graminis f. sp. tritici]
MLISPEKVPRPAPSAVPAGPGAHRGVHFSSVPLLNGTANNQIQHRLQMIPPSSTEIEPPFRSTALTTYKTSQGDVQPVQRPPSGAYLHPLPVDTRPG